MIFPQNIDFLKEGRFILNKKSLEEYKIRNSEKYSIECVYKNSGILLICMKEDENINDNNEMVILTIISAIASQNNPENFKF